MTPEQLTQITNLATAWSPMLNLAIQLGVKSFTVIRSMIQDAHANDPVLAQEIANQLQPKWDNLHDRVKRAAGL